METLNTALPAENAEYARDCLAMEGMDASVAPKQKKEGRLKRRWRTRHTPPADMVIYGIPLFHDSDCVFVGLKQPANPEESDRISTKIKNKLRKKWADWEVRRNAKPNGLHGKLYNYGTRKLEEVPPETRLLSTAPKKLKNAVVVYPASLDLGELKHDLNVDVTYGKNKAKKKLIAWSIATGIIAAGEAAAPFWPNIVTVVCAIFLLINYKSFRGGKQVKTALNTHDRAFFLPSEQLDRWVGMAKNEKGMLSNSDIERLCADIDLPELVEPLAELRKYKVRQQAYLLKKESKLHKRQHMGFEEVAPTGAAPVPFVEAPLATPMYAEAPVVVAPPYVPVA